MSLPLEQQKEWIKQKLGRDIEVSQVTINGTRCYLVDYVRHDAPVTKLAGMSEDEAIANLFTYLQTAPELPPEPAT